MELDVPHLFLWDPILFEGTPYEVNRVVVLMFVAVALCLGFFLYGAGKRALGKSSLAETGYGFIRNQIAIDVIGPEGAKYAGYLASVFFFILFCNILAIVPFVNFAPTSRMAIPAFLAIVTWLIFNVVGLIKQGPIRYFKDTLFPPGVPWPIYILLAPIELFSVFIVRPLTLAVRLLANMMAGHVMLTIFFLASAYFLYRSDSMFLHILSPFPFLLAVILTGFEMFIGLIQAFIITILTSVYIAGALHPEH